ncbi:hypothetical protein BC332_03299 [Capsicum chinense]|nr:hypothetical protein BC332_03299 [Capsicum chinense]
MKKNKEELQRQVFELQLDVQGMGDQHQRDPAKDKEWDPPSPETKHLSDKDSFTVNLARGCGSEHPTEAQTLVSEALPFPVPILFAQREKAKEPWQQSLLNRHTRRLYHGFESHFLRYGNERGHLPIKVKESTEHLSGGIEYPDRDGGNGRLPNRLKAYRIRLGVSAAAAGTELADAYSPDTVIASSPGKEVHDPACSAPISPKGRDSQFGEIYSKNRIEH